MMGQSLDMREAPVLRFSRYAVVFHFVDASRAAHAAPQPSPEFASFERDLLSFAYRAQPPFGSAIIAVPERLRQVEVHFPPALHYTSEGLDIRLLCADGAPTGGAAGRCGSWPAGRDFAAACRSSISLSRRMATPPTRS